MKRSSIVFASVAALGLMTTAAYATSSSGGEYRSHIRKHHVAHYRATTNTATDAQADQMLSPSKPDVVPEYFNHAVGSDGAM